jgi:hypothetical protein
VPRISVAAEPQPAAEAGGSEAAAEADDLRDPAALAELKRATDFLTALPRFRIKATVFYDVIQEDGRRLQFEKQGEICLQRPDRIFADVHLDDGRWRQLWYDGKTVNIAERSKNIHAGGKAPATIDQMLDMLEGRLKDPMPLSDLLYSDLRPLEARAQEADVVGDSTVGGRPCVHLAFRGETVDWQIWVEKGATPFVRKLVITYREQPGTPEYVAMLDVWETPERFADDRFTFVAPAGSQLIEVLVQAERPTGKGGQP